MGDMEGCALAGPPEQPPLWSWASGNGIGSCVPGMVTGPLGRSRAAQREADGGEPGGHTGRLVQNVLDSPKDHPQIRGVGSRDAGLRVTTGRPKDPPGSRPQAPAMPHIPAQGEGTQPGGDTVSWTRRRKGGLTTGLETWEQGGSFPREGPWKLRAGASWEPPLRRPPHTPPSHGGGPCEQSNQESWQAKALLANRGPGKVQVAQSECYQVVRQHRIRGTRRKASRRRYHQGKANLKGSSRASQL